MCILERQIFLCSCVMKDVVFNVLKCIKGLKGHCILCAPKGYLAVDITEHNKAMSQKMFPVKLAVFPVQCQATISRSKKDHLNPHIMQSEVIN